MIINCTFIGWRRILWQQWQLAQRIGCEWKLPARLLPAVVNQPSPAQLTPTDPLTSPVQLPASRIVTARENIDVEPVGPVDEEKARRKPTPAWFCIVGEPKTIGEVGVAMADPDEIGYWYWKRPQFWDVIVAFSEGKLTWQYCGVDGNASGQWPLLYWYWAPVVIWFGFGYCWPVGRPGSWFTSCCYWLVTVLTSYCW